MDRWVKRELILQTDGRKALCPHETAKTSRASHPADVSRELISILGSSSCLTLVWGGCPGSPDPVLRQQRWPRVNSADLAVMCEWVIKWAATWAFECKCRWDAGSLLT
jgi:hypothetical protein